MTVGFLLISLLSLLLGNEQAEIVFAGDAMQHQRQIDAARQVDGSYSYTSCLDAVAPYIKSADYAVVNLETPLGGIPYSGYPLFCAPDSYLTTLTDAGFDLMLAANNHCLDRRDQGVRRTISQFEQNDVPFIGIYRSKSHRDSILPYIEEINGFNVAFLNYTYGTNGLTRQTPIEIDYIDRQNIANDVNRARIAGAEIVVTCIHWGDEYHLLPNQSQRDLADYLVDLGVDLIIGGHPHVIQPMEMRYNEKTGKKSLVVYSLGNFLSGMRTTDTRGGALVKVILKRDVSGKAIVDAASYRLVFVQPPVKAGDNFRLYPAESDIIVPAWQGARDAFVNNAVGIFDRHNINVPRDTVSITLTDR